MRIVLIFSLVMGSLIIIVPTSALAQGSGKGLGQVVRGSGNHLAAGKTNGTRALGLGNRHAELNSAAMGRSAQNTTRLHAQHGSARAAQSTYSSGLNHSLRMRPNSPAVNAAMTTSEQQMAVQNRERIRSHQMNQAEHLRRVSEANGNEQLLHTAERMETDAQLRYERHTRATQTTSEDSSPKTSWIPNWLRRRTEH